MARYHRSIKPWRSGSPFGSRFRNFINEDGEGGALFDQMRPELERLIATPEQVFDEGGLIQAHFPVIIQGTTSIGWPKEYDWAEAQLVGTGQDTQYSILPNGRNSAPPDPDKNPGGLDVKAINRVELIPNFGTDVGPYGQLLSDRVGELVFLPIAPGSPAEMILERNDSDNIIPVFTPYNPVQFKCKVSPSVGTVPP